MTAKKTVPVREVVTRQDPAAKAAPRDPEHHALYGKHEARAIAELMEDRRLKEGSNGDYGLYLAKRGAAIQAKIERASKRGREIAKLVTQIREANKSKLPSKSSQLPGILGIIGAIAGGVANGSYIGTLEQKLNRLKEEDE